ncbi:uncharacterized protein LOC125211462 [Salvia hispanica]|uniref:uncharacterized protein LOC125211462 n=1 Tax=Salvia hispanica TaxID=49212 RepID=UPI002008F803|nr:uncharacterized protein LOC125211462 [Salvia hispanica]
MAACLRSLLLYSCMTVAFVAFAFGEETLFPTSGDERSGNGNNGMVVSLVRRERWRFLADNSSDEQVNNTTLILASKRTQRKDPFDDFHKYRGGWNISNRHYWASVAYTAVPFFVVGAIWFVIFGLCLIITCLYFCCCQKVPYGYSRLAYALSLILLTFFTIAAIIGCVILYTGQGKYHSSTINTLEYVVYQADTTSESLRNVSGYLAAAKQINVDQVILPSNVQGDIDKIQTKINSSATTLSSKTEDNSQKIKDAIQSVRLALIILSAVMLLLTFLGFVFSIFGMQVLVYLLVITGWILVTGTFILCGIFLLLHNVTGDTCVAMNQWVQNPTAHTALDDILPCVDNATAQETLTKSKEVTSQLVTLMNTVITNVSNANNIPNFLPFYFNQSGPLVPNVCNPFNPDLSSRACAPGETDLDNATQVLGGYVCQTSSNGICTTTGRLTPAIYNQMAAGVNVSYGLYKYGPVLVTVQDCTFVRDTFSAIVNDHCPGLRKYSQWIYVGLVMVALAVMLSLLFWVIYGRERRHRVYTKAHTPRGAPDFGEDKHA